METPKKEHKINNSKVIIHSPLVEMNVEERKTWFIQELSNGNPILKQIEKTMIELAN